ncbi:hypothetical protein [Halomonas sp. AOP43-D1-4]|uniref:hypothetical protein n=1 Tax=Halomonas sp. AOP43-D1-4 TaxID=3457658 RepID=UPI004034BA88
MNIVERTTAQLVRNRIHELTDLAMEINSDSKHGVADLRVVVGSVSLQVTSRIVDQFCPFAQSALLPPLATNRKALARLEKMLQDARAYWSAAQ